MQSSPNWARLFEEGRCKAIGIPWSEEEVHALHVLKIPIESVRNGCLTLEEYEEEQNRQKKYVEENGELPLKSMTRKELILIARDLGVVVDDAALKADLVETIQNKRKAIKKKEEEDEENKKGETTGDSL